jgi:nicotinate-nucleotide pyrophosphorylase (carboxylating)
MKPTPFDPIAIAIQEDIGQGDLTTEFFVPPDLRASAQITAREKAIMAGTETAAEVFRRIDPATRVRIVSADGSEVNPGDVVIEIDGLACSILIAERIALNFLQRLSGIATLTRKFVDAAANDRVKILDTRKTTPGLRALEKAAVVAGGGANHRFGLDDGILIKDNHIVACGGVRAAIERARSGGHRLLRIEVECETMEDVAEALGTGVDVILLDNMAVREIAEAVRRIAGRSLVEASGGVTLATVREIAETGIDLISVGALTHSAPAADLSMDLELL